MARSPSREWAVVGCYTTPDRRGRGVGLEVFSVEPTGEWVHVGSTPAVNPSYLTFDVGRRTLYVAHGARSALSAFRFDSQTGGLERLGELEMLGMNPVHLVLSPSGRYLLCANYTSGDLTAVEVLREGGLGRVVCTHRLEGAPGPNQDEQRGSHPHHMPMALVGGWLIVPDKGLDQVSTFRFDETAGRFEIGERVAAAPGAGPRHACFHPNGEMVYVNNELDATVSTYRLDGESGRLILLQSLSTLPPSARGTNPTGEIILSPSARRLYVSNRNHDSIVQFSVDHAGLLTSAERWIPSGGHFPRFMTLDPRGKCLYVANQDGHNICRFPLGAADELGDGELLQQTASPACIVFAPS